MPRKKKPSAQLSFSLPSGLVVDLSDRARKGIAVRLRTDGQGQRQGQGQGHGQGQGTAVSTADSPRPSRSYHTLPLPLPLPLPSVPPEPVTYTGVRVVNGRVIREGSHHNSQWNFAGWAGAVPRIHDYDPEITLERRADLDGIVRLLPIQDTPGEPLRELEYVVVDVETTGAGFGRGHRITEVAIVRLSGSGRVLDDYTTLINPERPIPAMITALTHIDGWMVRDAPRFREVARAVRDRLAGRIFVAHNAGFDWSFLSLELLRALGTPLRGRMLCTVRMARKFVPELRRRSLDSLSYYFNLSNEARHRAFGDARVTAEIFRRMLERVAEREITGWNQLQKILYARAGRRKRRSTPEFFDPSA